MRSSSVGLLLGSLALVASATGAGARPGATSDGGEVVDLPRLPSVAEREDGLYDAAGCLVTGPDAVSCSTRADDLDEALSEGPATEVRHLRGFVGSRWLGRVAGTGPAVVTPTVERSTAGAFSATGLARHEGRAPVRTVEVTARLLDASGAVLADVAATSPVHDVRPGEPVPFSIRADVPSARVAGIDWRATATGEGDSEARDLAWTPYWERPAGGQPVDLHLHHDRPGHRPHLLFGSTTSLAGRTLRSPEVVVAWLSAEGRVVRVVRTPLRDPDGSAVAALGPAAAADALARTSRLPEGSEPIVWLQGS